MFRPFGTPAASNPPPNPFGGSSTTSSGGFGGFGAPAPSGSTGLFGQTSAQTAPTASFTSGFGGGSAGALGGIGGAAMSTGTGNPSYTSTTDTEANMTIHLYCISAMPAYRGKSLEELRLEDYQAGKKTASAFPGTSTSSTGGGFFGSSAQPAQSSGMFGGASTSTSPFGFKPAAPAAPSFGGFGQTSAPAATSNPFGQPANTAPSFGAFGQPAAQPQSSGFGGFGQSMTQAQPAAAPAFGGFGQTAAQPLAQPQSGSFFGSNLGFGQQQQSAAPATNNPFGQPQSTPQSNPFGQSASGGVFGAKPAMTTTTTGFGGFGQPAQQAAPASTGAFNFQPSATSAPANTGGFNFGQSVQQNAPATSGFTFGQSPAATTAPASTGLGGFSFGPSSAATTAPATSSMFNLPSAATKIGSGFNFSPATGTTGTGFGTMGGMGGSALQQPTSALPLISPPDARLLSLKPPLPAGLESTKRATEPTPSTTSFKPTTTASTQPARLATDFVARPGAFKLTKSTSNTGPITTTNGGQLMTRMLPSVKKLSIPKSASISENAAPVNEIEEETTSNKHYGDYYMVPSMVTLKRMSYSQLASVSNFTVGQHGIGQVRFLKPVDLTGIDLDAILDHMIVFGSNQVVVYPEDDFPERPPVGQGLNQPAEVRLERCWPTARSTRDPITEMGGERMRRHIERIKSVEGTHFVDFFPDTGTWVFTVDHF